MSRHPAIAQVRSEHSRLVARLGRTPSAPRPSAEARDIYAEVFFARHRRAAALAAVCYWCGMEPAEALDAEAGWS